MTSENRLTYEELLEKYNKLKLKKNALKHQYKCLDVNYHGLLGKCGNYRERLAKAVVYNELSMEEVNNAKLFHYREVPFVMSLQGNVANGNWILTPEVLNEQEINIIKHIETLSAKQYVGLTKPNKDGICCDSIRIFNTGGFNQNIYTYCVGLELVYNNGVVIHTIIRRPHNGVVVEPLDIITDYTPYIELNNNGIIDTINEENEHVNSSN